MFRNYFLTAWRNLWKHKVYSIINIAGLAIGLAACITIMVFVSYERSFDTMHKKNIYRLNEVQKFEGMVSSQKVALSMFPMGPTLKHEFPEILNFCRISWSEKTPVSYGEKKIFLPRTLSVDSTFLDMFDFELLKGSRKQVLEKPNSIVLTERTASKIFGTADPIGKTLVQYDGDTTSFKVTGILKDVPQNSQFQFDAVVSFNTFFNPRLMENWGGNWLNTHLELAPGTDPKLLEKKFPGFLKKYMTRNDGWKFYELFLLPLKSVHAEAGDIGLDYLNFQKFDKSYTNIFFIIALVVLVIACINFMNLSTARSAERAREVGIRKSVGAHRWQLGFQFISESIILAFIGLIIAILLTELMLPMVNRLSERQLSFPFLTNPKLTLALIAGTLLVGIISGLYPAGYLSSFQPVKVLKGSINTGKNKSRLRNTLVVIQFSSAIFLIIATIFAVQQLRFMQDKDPGFRRSQVINVPLSNPTYQKYDLIKTELQKNSFIETVTAAQDQLGSHLDQSGVQFIGNGPRRDLTGTRLIVDRDYLRLYKIPVIHGRDFSPELSQNGKEYIINETMAKELLSETPGAKMETLLGKNFGFDSAGTIVGIAKDFNFNSLHNKIETLFIYNQKEWGFSTLSLSFKGENAANAIAAVENVWKTNFPEEPIQYQFLDDHFKEVYLVDKQVSTIVGVLAVLAIIISCLGLFGLATHAGEKRIKEVGVRKVMGASVQNIVSMLSIDFLKYVLISTLIAWPIAWFSVNYWLRDFAYRVPLHWWVFVLAGVAAIVIALATISYQAFKAAVSNPVKSLRTE